MAGTGAEITPCCLLIYRHGLRVIEAVGLKLDRCQPEGGPPLGQAGEGLARHRAAARRRRAQGLKRYLATREDKLPWLFVSERDCQMVRRAVNHMIAAAGKRAGLGHVHPHMLRHSCGYALANKGQDFRIIQDWLGHRDPKHTSRYTRVAARDSRGCGIRRPYASSHRPGV